MYICVREARRRGASPSGEAPAQARKSPPLALAEDARVPSPRHPAQSRLALMQARLADVNALVKIKNPSLLLQLQRTPQRMPPAPARGGRPY